MKKTILAVLLAMSVILTLCVACGSSKPADLVNVSDDFVVTTPEPTEEPTPTPEPTEEPEATPEPTEEPAEETDDSGNSDSQSTSTSSGQSGTAAAPTPTPVQDKKSVAMNMIGSDVGSLTSAIGSPNSSSYTESCLVLGGEDGFLYYDGFTVATIRRADGSEVVYDVY